MTPTASGTAPSGSAIVTPWRIGGPQPDAVADEIERPAFGLLRGAPQVLPQHAERDQLRTAEEEDRGHQGRPAAQLRARRQVVDDDVDAEREREQRDDQPQV